MRRAIPLIILLLLCAASLQVQEDISRVPPARTAPFLSLDDSLGITIKPGARDPMAPAEDSMRVALRQGVMTEESETKSALATIATPTGGGCLLRTFFNSPTYTSTPCCSASMSETNRRSR